VIEEWRDGDVPGDTSLAGELWSAVFEEPGTTTVHARDGALQTSVEAPFTTGDGRQAVLLRHAGRQGEFQLFKMSAVIRPTDDPNICEIEDDAGDLRDGDQLLLVGDEDRADEQIELYRRIAEFIAEVERTPERLEDVRQLLFLTAAMIDTPRCKGAHRAAATRAFEKARDYYDTARRSLARGCGDRRVRTRPRRAPPHRPRGRVDRRGVRGGARAARGAGLVGACAPHRAQRGGHRDDARRRGRRASWAAEQDPARRSRPPSARPGGCEREVGT
jgi:hypothetical protein